MKHFVISFALFFFSLVQIIAQPGAVKFQAIVHNGEGNLVSNQRVGFEISMIQGSFRFVAFQGLNGY